MDINTLTANKIKEIRKSLGLKAEAVAADLQINKSAYSELENGHTDITLKKLQAIADLWRIPVTDLFHSTGTIHQVAEGDGDNLHGNNKTVNHFF